MFYRIVAFKLSHRGGGSAFLTGAGSITVLIAFNLMALQIAFNHYTGRPLFGRPTVIDYVLVMCVLVVTYVMSIRFWVDNGRWGELVREFSSQSPTRRRLNSVAFWSYIVVSLVAPYALTLLWR